MRRLGCLRFFIYFVLFCLCILLYLGLKDIFIKEIHYGNGKDDSCYLLKERFCLNNCYKIWCSRFEKPVLKLDNGYILKKLSNVIDIKAYNGELLVILPDEMKLTKENEWLYITKFTVMTESGELISKP